MVLKWSCIGISPSGTNIIACKDNSGIYYSINNAGFTQVTSSIPDLSFIQIAISDISSNAVVCSTKNIYITTNYGVNWENISATNTNIKSINSVSISNEGDNIYVASSFGLYIYNQGSKLWSTINATSTNIWTGISTYDKYVVACTNGGGIYTSSNYGITDLLKNYSVPYTTSINWISICIRKYGFAMAGYNDTNNNGIIYVSTNNGITWKKSDTYNYPNNSLKKVFIMNYGYGLALTTNRVYITSNYGETWKIFRDIGLNDISVSDSGFLVSCDNTNIYSTSIYSAFNVNKIFTKSSSFVTLGILSNQLTFPIITNNQIQLKIIPSIIRPSSNYELYFGKHDNPSSTDISNIFIDPTQIKNPQYFTFSNLQGNTYYDISFSYIINANNYTLSQQIITKSEPLNVFIDQDSVTDISMNISFTPCINTPLFYKIFIQNMEKATDLHIYSLAGSIVNNNTNNNTFKYTITGLTNDASYSFIIDSSYIDYSYSSLPFQYFTTKSIPKVVEIDNTEFDKAKVSFYPPSKTTPNSIKCTVNTMKNVIVNGIVQSIINTEIPPGIYDGSIIFVENTPNTIDIIGLTQDSDYDIILESIYSNMIIQTATISYIAIGRPTVRLTLRKNQQNNTYTIVVNITLQYLPKYYLLTITYPDKTNETCDTLALSTTTVFDFVNLTQLGTYKIDVTAVFSPTSIANRSSSLSIVENDKVSFGALDICYNRIDVSFSLVMSDTTAIYSLKLMNTISSDPNLNYSYNIPKSDIILNPNSYYQFNNLYVNSGNYNLFITNVNNNFYYPNTYPPIPKINVPVPITLPIVNTVQIDSTNIVAKGSSGVLLQTYYTILYPNTYQPSYNLYVINNDLATTIYNIPITNFLDVSYSVLINFTGNYSIYLKNTYVGGSSISNIINEPIVITPDISFGNIDISYNYINIRYKITSFTASPQYILSISGSITEFNNAYTIIPIVDSKTSYILDSSHIFMIPANTGAYSYQLTDGTTIFKPTNNNILMPTITNIISNILYNYAFSFIVNYTSLYVYNPTYTVLLQNSIYPDISYSIINSFYNSPVSLGIIYRSSNNYKLTINCNYYTPTLVTYTAPPIMNISVNNTNLINYINYSYYLYKSSLTDTFFYQAIDISYQIISYDIIPSGYMIYLQNDSLGLTYDSPITLNISTDYSNANIRNYNNLFTNLYFGDYSYYIKDISKNITYSATNTINIPIPNNTFALNADNISVNISNTNPKYAKITSNIVVNYACYNASYIFSAINSINPDISYTSVYTENALSNTGNYFDISFISFSGNYNINILKLFNITKTETKIYLNAVTVSIGNSVTLSTPTYTLISNIFTLNIPYQIVSYDPNPSFSFINDDNVVSNITFPTITYKTLMPVTVTNVYTHSNAKNVYSENYNYSIIDNNTGFSYPNTFILDYPIFNISVSLTDNSVIIDYNVIDNTTLPKTYIIYINQYMDKQSFIVGSTNINSGTKIYTFNNVNNINLIGIEDSSLNTYNYEYFGLPYTATGIYTKSTYGIYTILKYTSGSGTFSPTQSNLKVGYLVVGGGSAGNPAGSAKNRGDWIKGGAGGNGGAISYSPLNMSNLTITQNTICNIVVGSGSTRYDISGNPSSISISELIIKSQGGTNIYISANRFYTLNGNDNTAIATGGIYNFNGGNYGGGGTLGYPANTGRTGKYVIINDISINSYYGGGGGGGGQGGSNAVTGANGGNGDTDGKGGSSSGNSSEGNPGYPGISNYGSGGGGGGGYYATSEILNYIGTIAIGGNGGSGVVIIYFPT